MTELADALRRQLAADPSEFVEARRRADVPAGEWRLADLWPLTAQHAVAVLLDPQEVLRPAPVTVSSDGRVRRAVPGDGAGDALVAACRSGTRQGRFEPRVRHPSTGGEESPIAVDQTNESVCVGNCVVKWFAVASDEPPAPGRVTALDAAGFTSMPRPHAFVWWHRDGRRYLLASVSQRLHEASDGWSWCVGDARAYNRGESALAQAVRPATIVGNVVAKMHLAFAASVRRTVASDHDVRRWHDDAVDQLQTARSLVDGEEGERLARAESRARELLDAIRHVNGPVVIPVHGDLHVGQVLRHRVDDAWQYAVTDFDGNPVLPPAQRLLRQPAARDVAGYLQSLDHVGRVLMRGTDEFDESAVRTWMRVAQETFLSAYRSTLKASGAEDLLDARLLTPFAVEQECREFVYAARHLPHWRYVADAALEDLVR